MALTLADQYYIKALDEYPYNLEVSIENLQYALSHNSEHVGALYLMGCLYMEQLEDYTMAEEYFQQAIAANPLSFKVYYKYCFLAVKLKEYKKAKKLLQYMSKIKGADFAHILQMEALLLEHHKQYEKALEKLEKAREETFEENFLNFLNLELERVTDKHSRRQPYQFTVI